MKKRLFSIILIIACFAVALFPCFNNEVSASADSVSYNQLYRVDFNQLLTFSNGTLSFNGLTCVKNNNTLTITGTFNGVGNGVWVISGVNGLLINSKILLIGNNFSETRSYIAVSNGADFVRDSGNGGIGTVSNHDFGYFYFRAVVGVDYNITFRPQLFDLTQMFGEGFEPSTVEEFRDMYPADYYDYTLSDWQVSVNLYETAYLGYTTPNADAFLLPDDLISAYKDNSDILISVFYDNGSFTVFGIILLSLLAFCLFFTVLYIVKKIINRGE